MKDDLALKIAFLKKSFLFNGLEEATLSDLATVAITCNFQKGDTIYSEGEHPDYVYLFNKGRIRLFSHSPTGKIVVARFTSEAYIVGEDNLVRDEPRWLSAQALDNVGGLKIYRADFLKFTRASPEVGIRIQGIMEQGLHGLFNRFKTSVAYPVEQRVYMYIYELYERFGDTLPYSDEDIGWLVGTTRETTVRALSRLKALGVIKTSRCSIKIVDASKLKEIKDTISSIS